MRWPACGSRPVVSVSTTISRTAPPLVAPPVFPADDSERGAQPAQGPGAVQAGIDDKIGGAALSRVGELGGEDGREARLAHAGAAQHPLALQPGRGGDDEDAVAQAVGAGFEQQRNVEHGEPHAPRPRLRDKAQLGGAHRRVEDGFEPAQFLGPAEDAATERRPVDAAGLAAPPGASMRCTAASASNSGSPSRRSIAAAVLLPMPIEPVSPMTIMTRASRGAPRATPG